MMKEKDIRKEIENLSRQLSKTDMNMTFTRNAIVIRIDTLRKVLGEYR